MAQCGQKWIRGGGRFLLYFCGRPLWMTPRDFVLHFLPRDAMRMRGLCCRPVSLRPSVCLSVGHVGALYPHG